MNSFYSKLAASIQPYEAGEQPKDKKYIKLNTNENPYSPSPEVEKVLKTINPIELRLYPDPTCFSLSEAIARKEGVKRENVFIGNGSDEVLALCFPAFFDDGDKVAFADITYSFYPVFCRFNNVNPSIIPLRNDFSLDVDDYCKLTDEKGIIIANPNAPTGKAISLEDIERIILKNPNRVVIIDEAYVDFYGKSSVLLTEKYDNILVVKTFSKSYSLAGIRCGFAIGCINLIQALERVKNCFNSYPIDRVCQKICEAAINDGNYYATATSKVVFERDRMQKNLVSLGMEVVPSDSNFLFAGHHKGGKYIYESLKEKGILVRFFDKDRLRNFVRITIGKAEDNDKLIEVLKEIL